MALTVEEVQKMLDGLEEKISVRINSFVMGGEVHHAEITQQRANLVDHEKRMGDILTLFKQGESQVSKQRMSA